MLMPFVDVEDVANAHVKGLLVPDAAGKRFICMHSMNKFTEMAGWMVKYRSDKLPANTQPLPYCMVCCCCLCACCCDCANQMNKARVGWDKTYSFDTTPAQ